MKNKLTLFLMVLMSSILLAACGGNDNNAATEDDQNEEQPNEQVDPEKVVAKVNGEEIKGQDYNSMMQQTQMMMMQYGQAGDPETIKEQTLNTLIDQELLSQEVANKGYTATEEEVEESIAEIKANYETEEQFEEELESIPLTMETLKKQIADDVAFRKYLDKELAAAEITDEQVKEYYEQAKEQSEAQKQQNEEQTEEEETPFPELADVQDQIRSQLEQQEVQKQLQAIVEDLKANSEIERLI
ncbi:SurA N-terminal domain-containing protein [Sutcliffiella halmapala]|uniref:SurA N-terminal domain-containing protein n=1 Tax=Sutcliffiella halmapala TaxID=79882 RepID=UPI000994E27D|nr:SurA N-terminal domain-containing protein [Sutcliffiella halmapala]